MGLPRYVDTKLYGVTADITLRGSHFRSDRFFYQSDLLTNQSGWYITARNGIAHGPYITRHVAEEFAVRLKAEYVMARDTGGR